MSKSAHQSQAAFYRAQAQTAIGQAEDAQLDNVRQRCLRSAEAWTHMAVRAERHEEGRKRTDAYKAGLLAEESSIPTE